MVRFEDLNLRLIPQQKPPKAPVRVPFRISHLKSGSKQITLSARARTALGSPRYIQVLADNAHIAIRACEKGDPDAREVGKTGAVLAIELIRMLGIEQGERLALQGVMDAGHLVASVHPRVAKGGAA